MDKIRYAKYVAQQRELNKDKVCEYCGKEHDHTYGTGRFCSESCYKSYVASKNKGSEKCKAHLNKLRDAGIIRQPAPYGTWKCEKCNLIYETEEQLILHHQQVHKTKLNLEKLVDDLFKCPYCGFTGTRIQTMGHLASCKQHPNKEEHDLAHKNQGKTYKKKLASGEITHGGFVKGSHHTPESKEKIRKSVIQFRESLIGKPLVSYNKESIQFLNELSIKMGWHLQHAENGGEVRMFGYFLDAYDKENNVVVDYDEKEHYIDVENNILRPKDIERQNYIIEKLHCDFYRYNEYTKTLYKIN